ncbi:MAG: exosortase/archaeosortase family protein [Ferruginibacter sp.]|nr:exosortase/archaeosortase family protein [Ferruginibacter sp.]
MNIKSIKTELSKYIDVDYFVRFLLLLLALRYFNVFYIAIVDQKGLIYSSFLDNYLNYISWIRNSVLYSSNAITHAMGINSYVSLPFYLKTVNGSYVEMVYDCLGLGLMSFWVAFVVANKESLKRKITWCAGGIICMWFINCWRVALLLIALENHWKLNSILDHHTLFNIVAYSLILIMIYLYTKDGKKVKVTEKSRLSKYSLLTRW